jgi:hypothetical protein
VAIEKVLHVAEPPKLGDQKCMPSGRSPFTGHPSAPSFQGEDAKRVFRQPRLLSPIIRRPREFLAYVTSMALKRKNKPAVVERYPNPFMRISGPFKDDVLPPAGKHYLDLVDILWETRRQHFPTPQRYAIRFAPNIEGVENNVSRITHSAVHLRGSLASPDSRERYAR